MRYFAALLTAAAVASAATGSISTYMPECAVPCLTSAISGATTCKGPDDLECFCIADNYRAIYDSSVGCVLQACGDDVALGKTPPPLGPPISPSVIVANFFPSTGEVLPAAAKMCEEVVAASGQPVTSVGDPAPTNTVEDPATTGTTTTAESASTSTNAADARCGAHVFGLVAPLVLAAAANL